MSRALSSFCRWSPVYCSSVRSWMSVLRSMGMTCEGEETASRPMSAMTVSRMENSSSLRMMNSEWMLAGEERKGSKWGSEWKEDRMVERMVGSGSEMDTVSRRSRMSVMREG